MRSTQMTLKIPPRQIHHEMIDHCALKQYLNTCMAYVCNKDKVYLKQFLGNLDPTVEFCIQICWVFSVHFVRIAVGGMM